MSGRVGQATSTLPPRLREICDILARGMVRLKSRSIAEKERDNGDLGETSLRITPRQSGHANRNNRRDA